MSPFPKTVKPGETVTVTCATGEGVPTPGVRWMMGSTVIEANDKYSIFTHEEEGQYQAKYSISTLTFAATSKETKKLHCELGPRAPRFSYPLRDMLSSRLRRESPAFKGK